MSSGLAFVLYLVGAAMVLGALALVWSIGRSLRSRNDRRHEVTDPAGLTWSTRLHWGRPGAGIGVGRRLFPSTAGRSVSDQRSADATDQEQHTPPSTAVGAATAPVKSKRRRGGSGWLDALEIFDEGFLLIVGLLVTFGLLVAAVIIVLLAIELILILLVASALAVLRSLFGHPWVIETTDPDGYSSFTAVRRLRIAVATHRRLRRSIETGIDPGPFEV